jgi:hypothetical protein
MHLNTIFLYWIHLLVVTSFVFCISSVYNCVDYLTVLHFWVRVTLMWIRSCQLSNQLIPCFHCLRDSTDISWDTEAPKQNQRQSYWWRHDFCTSCGAWNYEPWRCCQVCLEDYMILLYFSWKGTLHDLADLLFSLKQFLYYSLKLFTFYSAGCSLRQNTEGCQSLIVQANWWVIRLCCLHFGLLLYLMFVLKLKSTNRLELLQEGTSLELPLK